jgi:hypothetical protein
MTLQEIANALGGEVSGGEVLAAGPGHSAKDRSMSVTISKDGEPIVHSFSGDDDLMCKDFVREKLGIKREIKKAPRSKTKKTYKPASWVSFIPEDAPQAPDCKPNATATFRDAEGRESFAELRFNEKDGGKHFNPLTLWKLDDGGGLEWRFTAPPAPRTLYNLDQIKSRPEAGIILCEGPKCCNAASIIFPEMVAVTSLNGAQSSKKNDWKVLAGRTVIQWPDGDEPGQTYADEVAAILATLPGTVVLRIDAMALARIDPKTGGTREAPAKFDAAFALGKGDGEDGWPLEALRTAALGLVQPVDMAVVCVKDSNIIDLATVRARVEAAGSDAAETLVELIKDVPPEDRDAIAIAKIVQFAAKRSKVGTKVIKDRIARDANESGPHKSEGSPPSEEDDGRPIIQLEANQMPRIVDEIEAAILLADLGLYQRGGLIVRVEDRKFLGFEEKEIIATAIAEQCEHTLLEDAEGAAIFLKFNERKSMDSSGPNARIYKSMDRTRRALVPSNFKRANRIAANFANRPYYRETRI